MYTLYYSYAALFPFSIHSAKKQTDKQTLGRKSSQVSPDVINHVCMCVCAWLAGSPAVGASTGSAVGATTGSAVEGAAGSAVGAATGSAVGAVPITGAGVTLGSGPVPVAERDIYIYI